MKVVYKNSIGPRAEYRRNSPEAQAGCKAASLRRKEKAVLVDASAAFVFSRGIKRTTCTLLDASRSNVFSVLRTVVRCASFLKYKQLPVLPSKLADKTTLLPFSSPNAQIYPHARVLPYGTNVTRRYVGA